MTTHSFKTGATYGDWTLIKEVHDGKRMRWLCKCVCGTTRAHSPANLYSGRSKGCGCSRARTDLPSKGEVRGEWTVLGLRDHQAWCRCSCGAKRWIYVYTLGIDSTSCGHARRNDGRRKAKLKRIWSMMWQRCTDPNDLGYKDYGGRGIYVCKRWKSFHAFYEWAISQGYEMLSGLQIDRSNNDGPYSPENCKWVTSIENARNKRTTHWVTAWGETKCLAAWPEDTRCKVSYGVLHARLRKGEQPEEAMARPTHVRRQLPSAIIPTTAAPVE